MARSSVVKALVRAGQQATTSPIQQSGFGSGPVPIGSQGPSPLVASYGDWTGGRLYGTALPRDPAAFLAGAFGPLEPMRPIAIDQPEQGMDRPTPRRWQYPVSWNIPNGTPGNEGLNLASFDTLRTIGDTYSVARACIQVRKSELMGLGWDIVPTKAKEKAMRQDQAARKEFEERRVKMLKFWRRPDTDWFSFRDWFSVLLEDVLVIDAFSLYLWPSLKKGKGVLGSNLGALAPIDGATIKPLLDVHGGRPKPPNPAYQAFEYGVPRVDLMSLLMQDDDATDSERVEYRGDQLIYRPFTPRDWTPYGFAPLEQALVPVLSGLQRQQWQLDFFSEGSVPALFVTNGDANSTPQQNRELQDALNAMATDPAWKHKIIVLPGGSQTMPQRPADLAGQFDELVMTQVCMAFSVMPMELGITPRASSSGHSAGAHNQMGKLSEDAMERKANLPMLEWFSDVFNHIIQGVLGQEDMQWWWEGLEADEDEQTKTGIQKEKVSIGLMSIDEARIENGQQPWGLDMTSEPVMITATGAIPLGSIDPNTGQPKGLTDKLTAVPGPMGMGGPPGAPGAPGGAPKPPQGPNPAGGGGQPQQPARSPAQAGAQAANATATKTTEKVATGPKERELHVHAALRELDLIRRRLVKGRSLARWVPEHLPIGVFLELSRTGDVDAARRTVKATGHRQRRDAALVGPQQRVVDGLRGLAAGVADGSVATPSFVDSAVAIMRDGIREGLATGVAHARTAGVGKVVDPTGSFGGRYGLYAGQVSQAYEQGYGLATIGDAADPDNVVVVWHARPGACALCDARDNTEFTVGTLPGWPGDGGFGPDALICMGGPNCRCELEYRQVTPEEAGLVAGQAPTPPVPVADTQQRTAEQLTLWRDAVGSGEDAEAQALDRIAQQQAERQRPYLQGLLQAILSALGRARTDEPAEVSFDGRQTRTGTASHVDGDDSGSWWQHVVITVVAAALAAALAAQVASQQRAAPAADTTTPAPAVAAKAAGTDAEHVVANLAGNYPVSALGWVWGARWHGPIEVPTDQVDVADEKSWAAHHEPERVEHFAGQLSSGGSVRPGVSVREPGKSRIKVIDGHHRYLAAVKAGKPFRTYVGDVDSNGGPWDETHLYQRHQGTDPANKAKQPVAAGLAVRAKDTGRVLMLQRAMSDDDPAAGMWEFPGGRLEDDEDALGAARREWAEETGCHVPDGEPVGKWKSGKYRGFVVEVPNEDAVPIHDGRDEVTNPDDPDRDQIESLAWWDPDHLKDNPAVRAELSKDIDDVLDAVEKTILPMLTKATHVVALKVDEGAAGDYRARHLIRWYEHGEGAAEIAWGTPGDFDRCVALAGKHMRPDQAKGFCNLRHHGALGYYPATHAAMERGKK